VTAPLEVSPTTKRFLFEHVHSHEQLETLFFLHSRKAEAFTPNELAQQLAIQPEAATSALEHLHQQLLVVTINGSGKYRLQTDNPTLAAGVDELMREYQSKRVQLLTLLGANAVERLRSSAMKIFAEAFKLGGPKKNG
jgi:hypothetical protein